MTSPLKESNFNNLTSIEKSVKRNQSRSPRGKENQSIKSLKNSCSSPIVYQILLDNDTHFEIAKKLSTHDWVKLSRCSKELYRFAPRILFGIQLFEEKPAQFPLGYLMSRLSYDQCQNLNRLSVFGNKQQIDLSEIKSQFPRLQKLEIACKENEEYSFVSSQNKPFKTLQKLHVINGCIPDLDFLAHLTTLKELNLSCTEVQDFSGLGECTSLTSLNLSASSLSNETPPLGSKLRNVRRLDLAFNEINDVFIKSFAHLNQLDLFDSEIEGFSGYVHDYLQSGTIVFPDGSEFNGRVLSQNGDLSGIFNFDGWQLIHKKVEGVWVGYVFKV